MICDSRLADAIWRDGRADDCPIIDVHGHMGTWRGFNFPRASARQMVETMDVCGIQLLVFCHHAALFAPDIGNDANISAVREFPDRLRAYMGIVPHCGQVVARDLARYDDYGDVFVGLKFLADYHNVPWDDESFRPAWEFADRRGLIVLGHTWSGSAIDGPAQVRKAAETYPNVRLLLGHCIHGDWNAAVELAGRFDNVYLELTSVPRYRGTIERFVGAGLSHKLLFGTDIPWFDPHQAIGAILSADVSDDVRHDIFHRNAQRLLDGAMT